MTGLKTIFSIFENHEISNYPELKYQKLEKSEKYPSSEGITFKTSKFSGEIFFYDNEEMKYCEMEFLIYNKEKYFVKIVEELNKKKLNNSISEFLTKNLLELKNS
jgi:hypothetical protein